VEGRNFTMEERNADGALERLKAQAVELQHVPTGVNRDSQGTTKERV
jgi:hypothetical protein